MLAYGFDWLAFAHIVIAMAFIGPLKDPVKNKWIIDWAILACLAIIPLAFIAGPIRHIPIFHILIDCSFGVIGLIPLLICRKMIKQLEKNNFTVYPNPADDVLHVRLEPAGEEMSEVKIFSYTGSLIFRKSSRKNITLNTSEWKSGFYFISVSNNKKVVSQKLDR